MPEAVSPARDIAVLGQSITVQGDITGEESLVIDGKVTGKVSLKQNDLTVGQTGRVSGDVTANVARIEGEVRGDIHGIEKVVVTRSGRVQGNIVAPRVTLEEGAKFKGSIDMDPGPAAPVKPEPAPQSLRSVPGGVAGTNPPTGGPTRV
jgi:cytoskeletal protein CcmA (bactofilin family)